MRKQILSAIFALTALYAGAQNSYWQAVSEAEASKGKDLWANHDFKPAAYKLFQLNEAAMRGTLLSVPAEKTTPVIKSGAVITLPDAAGNMQSFKIVESPVMQPGLAAKYPSIKTYTGKGIEDASATLHCALTSSGFSASVTSVHHATYYVNLLDKAGSTYIVNARSDKDPVTSFECTTENEILNSPAGTDGKTLLKDNADDGKLREYRLALCVAGEFSQYFLDGSEPDTAAMKAKVMNVLVTYMIRANEVYERDFGIRLLLVDKQDTIIFIDPAKDPFPKYPSNTKVQKACDDFIGTPNYDIGHEITSYNAGGNAGCIGCVCAALYKGSGFTGTAPDVLDYFVIDYWTHEMGHQFGSNHTYTYASEGTQAQIEPGSGSTIMGYAGITGNTDVQAHSDDLFAITSISQNAKYMKTGLGNLCAVATVNGNSTPVVDAGADYIIPKSTPFQLTGTASDADAGDVLSYCWEQIDVGSKSTTYPSATATVGPLFRTYNYLPQPVRYFPDMAYILNGTNGFKWEVLSGVTRDINFRFTARDNHVGGGNNKSDDMLVTTDVNSGPFTVTTQNNSVETWHGGDTKTITWDVANTDVAPVSCSNVNILLSVDNGATFTSILSANTPNDGTEDITVPSVNTGAARIKIEAVGNIFFDINNAAFSIESVLPISWLSFTAKKAGSNSVLLNWSTTNEISNKYFLVERSSDGIHFAKIGNVTAIALASTMNKYAYTDYNALNGANYYRLQQVDANGKGSYSAIAKVVMDNASATWTLQPNPAKDNTMLYARSSMSHVTITLVNASGKTVFTISRENIAAGEEIAIPVNNLAKGLYMVRLQSNENTRTEKLLVQ